MKNLSLAVLSAAALVLSLPAGAQATYTVKDGDTLLSIGEQLRGKASMNQMALAIARANKEPLKGRPGLVPMTTGTVLAVPDEKTVLATSKRRAEIEVAKIWRGEQYFKAGQALEKSGPVSVAFDTYTYAAGMGHGPSQLRLAQLYDRDTSGVVKRDFQESIRWYERARQEKVPFSTQRARGLNLNQDQ